MEHLNLTTEQTSSSIAYRYKKSGRQKDIEKFMKFRQQNQSLTEKISNDQLKALKAAYLHGITGRDQHNHVVVVDKVGSIKMGQILKILDEDLFVNYTLSRLINLSEVVLSQSQSLIWVFDLDGKIMQLASKKAIIIVTKIIDLAVYYFPEIISKIIFVNAPMLFDTVWNQLSAKISEQTHKKIFFLADDQLFQHISPYLIPQFLGGKIADQQLNKNVLQLKESNQNLRHKDYQEKSTLKSQKGVSQDEQKQIQQQNFDFSSLKAAFSGMSFGKNIKNTGILSIAQTPLNTQADDR